MSVTLDTHVYEYLRDSAVLVSNTACLPVCLSLYLSVCVSVGDSITSCNTEESLATTTTAETVDEWDWAPLY